MNREVWEDIIIEKNGIIYDFKNFYKASNYGRIKSCKRIVRFGKKYVEKKEKILTPYNDRGGYKKVKLSKNGESVELRVHRIIASLFIPNPENKPQVDHIDTNRTNNNVSNLRWATRSENVNNPITLKKRDKVSSISAEKLGIKVVQYDLRNNFIKEWKSQSEASRQLKINSTHICRCCKGSLKTAGGYVWKYKKGDGNNK